MLYGLILILLFTACSNEAGKEEKKHDENKELISSESTRVYKIVIDPGHGGEDPGATGASGQHEKEFTLSLSKKIAALLEQEAQIQVLMTREEDVFLSAEERFRPKFANENEADLYISIHGNTFDDPSVSGTASFYYHQNSKAFANTIHQKVVNATSFKDRGVNKENFFVLKDTNMPAVLLEIGYMTNPDEEQQMLSDNFQKEIANSIYEGVIEFLDLSD
ncbi:N-acetylmuramoyl-L-alanine amidase [Bacillaceae bacterium Marseille-Q3522]|nr:N-acetylmuramoyl-L-alanine amidase [Bacillaceae bacterium Marseille-Q3522]